MKVTNTVNSHLSLGEWLHENFMLFKMRMKSFSAMDESIKSVFERVESLDAITAQYSRKRIRDCQILEIGFGANPHLMIALQSMGCDVIGIDLDQPVLHFRTKYFYSIYKKNGVGRLVKSFVRSVLFDKYERNALARLLESKGFGMKIDESAFKVGDAAEFVFEKESFDLIFSNLVFMHIPIEKMRHLVRKMSEWLRPDGIALIRIGIHTGISGGLLTEWYPHLLNENIQRRSDPWEHLRKKRFEADYYQNKLRLKEYRQVLSGYFDILEEINETPDLGRKFLTPEIRAELSDYSESELLSFRYTFILGKPSESPMLS